MAAPKCPSCRRQVLPKAENPCFPFCTDRRRLIDLAKWMGEEYRVADRSPELDEDGMPGTPGDGTTEDPH